MNEETREKLKLLILAWRSRAAANMKTATAGGADADMLATMAATQSFLAQELESVLDNL
jgi:hypothetical protein